MGVSVGWAGVSKSLVWHGTPTNEYWRDMLKDKFNCDEASVMRLINLSQLNLKGYEQSGGRGGGSYFRAAVGRSYRKWGGDNRTGYVSSAEQRTLHPILDYFPTVFLVGWSRVGQGAGCLRGKGVLFVGWGWGS
jgi:hypothetical protein